MGRLIIEPAALAFLRSMAPGPKQAVRAAIDGLRDGPRPKGLDWKRLETSQTTDLLYRLRVGDYRVAYVLRDEETRIIKIFHRDEGYRWLERMGF